MASEPRPRLKCAPEECLPLATLTAKMDSLAKDVRVIETNSLAHLDRKVEKLQDRVMQVFIMAGVTAFLAGVNVAIKLAGGG